MSTSAEDLSSTTSMRSTSWPAGASSRAGRAATCGPMPRSVPKATCI